MNIVFIMTDTQTKDMVGAYGNPEMRTPNLDRLASEGLRFERAYTTCPLCTPARAGIFTGLYPQNAGPWCNNLPIGQGISHWGDIFSHYGYRTVYTGKWHLDGGGYFGDGVCPENFEEEYWYDGKRYAEEIGPEMFAKYRSIQTTEGLVEHGFTEENCWGYRVADRAVRFLNTVGDEPFVLVASFDEPHGPFICPPGWWDDAPVQAYPDKKNFRAPTGDKPQRQQLESRKFGVPTFDEYKEQRRRFLGCNAWIDTQIGRVLDAVDAQHKEDTVVIYTSDHGDMWGAHGLTSKGPQMYEETNNIPFLVRMPDGPVGGVSNALVSHLDILPTLLDVLGLDIPDSLHGVSQKQAFLREEEAVRDSLMMCYNRFAINHDMMAGFYPIRAVTDGRWKLVINLLDTDELYDLETDPGEMNNRIDDLESIEVRHRLHDQMIREMNASRDPMRNLMWAARPWRDELPEEATTIKNRKKPQGFPFEAEGMEG